MCEQALRQLYASAYFEKYGADWLAEVATEEQRTKWREKREVERKKRTSRGVAAIDETELAYAEFYELREIAERHWEPVASALKEQRVTLGLLKRFDDLRNTVAHSREVLPFEADLLSGIAGEIRNRVTIYMTGRDENDEYFGRAESVTDSFGNTAVPGGNGQADCMTNLTLRVGDKLTFACRGTDAQGRAIKWSVASTPWASDEETEGPDATLNVPIRDAHVSQRTAFAIRMVTASKHHRIEGAWDAYVIFYYRVLPA